MGKALIHDFGLTSSIGRYSGHKFVVFHQIKDKNEASELRNKIKDTGKSIKTIDGVPITIYLSVGYVLFSEVADLEEQAKLSEIRIHADHDQSFSAENLIAHSSEIFHLFDDLPISYSVYHVAYSEQNQYYDAVIFYVNHKYEEFGGRPAKEVIGHSVRELYPYVNEEWFEKIKRAALDGEIINDYFVDVLTGKRFRFTVHQIIYPGYCAVTYIE